ncbi:hypothetical protein ACFL35_01535 [Candidatus Riflebacteria bacterium]
MKSMRAFLLLLLLFFCGCGCGRKEKKQNQFSLNEDVQLSQKELQKRKSTGRKKKGRRVKASSKTRKRRKQSSRKKSPDEILWGKRNIARQKRFDGELAKILSDKKKGYSRSALLKTRSLLHQFPNDPYFRMQLHYLEAELLRKLGGPRKGLYYKMIEDLKNIRREKVMDKQVEEGKAAANLVHETMTELRRKKRLGK